jgi:signal transduction histidine kinase
MDASETKIFTAILIISIVLGVIIIFFIISTVRNQRLNQKLYKSKILAEITTLENERARIASDLHDELGPILSAVKLRINSLDIHSPNDQLILDKSNKNIDELIRRMREISNDLLPNILLRKGLITTMEKFVEDFKNSNKLEIKFTCKPGIDIPKEMEINIYRILQEIIHNTIKHAQATELRVKIIPGKQQLLVLTEDNGKGFDYIRYSRESTGLGLRNLLSRTEVLGGKMYIESGSGKGTKYTFELPS